MLLDSLDAPNLHIREYLAVLQRLWACNPPQVLSALNNRSSVRLLLSDFMPQMLRQGVEGCHRTCDLLQQFNKLSSFYCGKKNLVKSSKILDLTNTSDINFENFWTTHMGDKKIAKKRQGPPL